jgi:Pyruvate/2-oxoacid:ferredoxin oxidoreductase gamma subunit
LAAITGLLSPQSLDAALHRRFSTEVAQRNARAAIAMHESVIAGRASRISANPISKYEGVAGNA